MTEYTCDLCVVAAGPAGLAASVQAAEKGADVILIEKQKKVGGAANMGMGILGIGTKYQKRQMYDISVEKALKMYMEYTHYNVDIRLMKRYFEQSAGTVEWLEDMGVEFEGAYKYFTKSEPTWHIVKCPRGIGPAAARTMNEKLLERAKELGVRVLFETSGKEILKESGKVCGVLAQSAAGEEITIHSKAAVIATGGAGANKEMLHEETGYTFMKDMFSFAVPGCTGDGLKMAWAAGAEHLPVRIEQAASPEGLAGLSNSVSNIMGQGNLLVNLEGKRFMNEEDMQNVTFLSNAISAQKERVGLSVVDSSIVEYYVENGVDEICMVRPDPDVSDFPVAAKKAKEKGHKGLFIADTLEELAEMTGVNKENFLKTVEDYNRYCDSTDEEFFKPKKLMRKLVKAPFYAVRFRPGGYGTVGGIRINENCEACDVNHDPVPGLYAAGADACNIYNDSYMFLLPGNSMGFAVNTGRIAGMSAAEYIKR